MKENGYLYGFAEGIHFLITTLKMERNNKRTKSMGISPLSIKMVHEYCSGRE